MHTLAHRRRLGPIVLSVIALASLAAALAAGCGATDQADQAVDAALERYNNAVDRVRELDLKQATQQEIAEARRELEAAFGKLEARAREAGRDTADLLRSANEKLSRVLRDAADLPAQAREQAGKAIRSAAGSVSSTLKSVWDDLKGILE